MNRVCYLIPYYNAYEDLVVSLDSLSEGVDVVIVDDGSSSPLIDRLDKTKYSFNIFILTMTKNMGIEHALNYGIDYISGKYEYVARLDAGDKSYDSRIEKQLGCMGDDVVLVGSWANFVDEQYNFIFTSKLPQSDSEIRKKLYLNNVFVHPSVMMNVDAVVAAGRYPTNTKCAEDYGLFFELSKRGRVMNLGIPLIDYVVSPNSLSSLKRKQQIRSRLKIVVRNYEAEYTFYFVRGVFRCFLSYVAPRQLTTFLRRFISAYE